MPPANSVATVSVKISESGYAGNFAESDDCSAIATISPPSVTTGPSVTYTVQPLANKAGTCTLVVGDTFGQKVSIPITITSASIVVK